MHPLVVVVDDDECVCRAMERLLQITVDYLKTRKQFGQPLASFQALQHRLAEMLVAKELALSMAQGCVMSV